MTLSEAFGDIISEALPDGLTLPMAIAAWHAIDRHRDFTFIEARRHDGLDGCWETLIVDSENDGVPTRNSVRIRYRERLALTFCRTKRLPEVYALRPDFPVTIHQNASAKPPYRSLCIYAETWTALRRTWTAEKHLERILWWLAGTATGTLHRPDQPLEQLYFQSYYEFVVPHDFADRLAAGNHDLAIEGREGRSRRKLTLIGRMIPAGASSSDAADFACLALAIPPVVHGPIERSPPTLGELHDQLARRGSSLAPALIDAIKSRCVNSKFPNSKADKTMLVLSTPFRRDAGGEVERIDITGFVAVVNISELGVAIGALDKTDRGYWSIPLIGNARQEKTDWRKYQIIPVEIVLAFTHEMARQASGIEGDGPRGILAGAGALGTEMFNLWTRSGWGHWTLIDPDQIRPHNLARHHALERHVGLDKVDVVKGLADLLFTGQSSSVTVIADQANNFTNEQVKAALEAADLIVDATTTLEFPRDLAAKSNIRRAVTVFLTPSGCDAVMLLEDAQRAIPLDCLEAQYYRQVISKPWGAVHLTGNRGHLWTGASCRDVSYVIPNELIGIHGANLAAMVRVRANHTNAAVLIWQYDKATGSLSIDDCAPAARIRASMSAFEIMWDREIRDKVRAQRMAHLPKETGSSTFQMESRVY